MALLEDAELITDADEHVDMELFSDSLTIETFPTGRQNNRRHLRRTRRNLNSQGEVQTVSGTSSDNNRQNSSDIQTITHEQLQTNVASDLENDITEIQTNVASDLENDLTEIQNDESIYEVPEDDYSYLNDNSTCSEDLPFHTVNWNLEDNQSILEEKSSKDVCT
ncbi:hypothetical protein RF55_12811, partial [Lasius niger]